MTDEDKNYQPQDHSPTPDKKTRSYYGVRPPIAIDNATENKNDPDGSDEFEDIDFNDGKNRYVIIAPKLNSLEIEAVLRKKYPKSSFSRMNNDEFKMTSADGKEIAVVHSNTQGKHIILMERPTNRVKVTQDTVSEAYYNNPSAKWRTNSLGYMKDRKEREDDERPWGNIQRTTSTPVYQEPPKNHYAIVDIEDGQLDHRPNITKISAGKYAHPITQAEHDKFHALGSDARSWDENDMMSDEDHRAKVMPKHKEELLSKLFPNHASMTHKPTISAVRKTINPEPNDHYALLHVPKGAEEEVKNLKGVKKSPKGRFYVMIPKSIHEMDSHSKNLMIGDMTGFHHINNINNPKRHSFAPNYNMDHAIKVDKTLSPADVVAMKTNK